MSTGLTQVPRSWVAAVTVLALSGCAPSLPELLEEHHLNEAVCAAADSYDPGFTEQVTSVLESDLDPAIHLAAVGEVELRPLFGERTDDILRRLVILHLTYEANEAPLDRHEVTVTPYGDGEALPWLYPSRTNLAQVMGETLPGTRTVEDPLAEMRDAAVLGAGVALPLAAVIDLGTLGLFDLTEHLRDQLSEDSRRRHTVYPTEREYAAQAPLTELTYRLATGAFGPHYADGLHHGFLFFQRPAAMPSRMQIEVSVVYMADRMLDSGIWGGECILSGDPIVLDLGEATRIEDGIRRIFGQRMMTLGELREMASSAR